MKWLLLLYVICLSQLAFCQDTGDYAAVDSKALGIPNNQTFTTAGIAGFINNNFTSSRDKLRAAYKWITTNIRYSKDSMYFSNWGGDPEVKMESTLRKKRGVCENYAGLLSNIANKCGIRSVVVSGYTSLNGSVSMAGHSWCAVELDSAWWLCDPTWDGGFTSEARYFLVEPSAFISTHMPFDPLWQLLPEPISHKEFRRGFSYSKKQEAPMDVNARVQEYLAMDTVQQLETTANRIKEAGFDNEELKTWHAYNQMKVNIVHQEENMTLYNTATDLLNKARKAFNKFVQLRNEGKLATTPPAEVKGLFQIIETSIRESKTTAGKIGQKAENYQYDTGELLEALDKLSGRLKEQQQYYNSLAATGKLPSKK